MKINLNVGLLNNDDKPMLEGEGAEKRQSTAKLAVITALTSALPGDENLKDDAKHKLYKLSKRVKKGGEDVELSAEELTTIKQRVAIGFSPLISGQVWDVIEGVSE